MMHHVAGSSKFENMFKGMGTSGMQSITLGPYAVLENTGFGFRDTDTEQNVPFLARDRWSLGYGRSAEPRSYRR